MSTCKTSNLEPVGKEIKGGFMCRVILLAWQSVHDKHQSLTSLHIENHTTFDRIIFRVDFMPGWWVLCIDSKAVRWREEFNMGLSFFGRVVS